jgi:RNA polymerase sigma factor (sigma-70 family)
MNTISHADLFPHEAFPENPDDMPAYEDFDLIVKNSKELQKRIRLERIVLLGEDRNLTFQEQQDLAVIIQEGIQATTEAEALGAEYDGSLDAIIVDGLQAKHILVTVNLLFAIYFVRKTLYTSYAYEGPVKGEPFRYKGIRDRDSSTLEFDDRTQIAMLAMWEAADKYIPGKDASFASYASWNMHRKLQRYSETNTLGLNVQKAKLIEYRKITEQDSYAHEIGTSKLHPENILLGRRVLSLDDIGGSIAVEEETGTIIDRVDLPIADLVPENAVVNDEVLHDTHLKDLRWTIHDLLNTLSDREAEIIRLRYGLTWEGPMSCEEVGKRLSVSKQRINQIELRALRKFRQPNRIMYLEDFNNDDSLSLPNVLPTNVDGIVNVKSKALLVPE